MLVVVDIVVGLGRFLLLLGEVALNLVNLIGMLYDTGCGLRWLFSAGYRKALREEPDTSVRSWKRASVCFGLFLIGMVLLLPVVLLFKMVW